MKEANEGEVTSRHVSDRLSQIVTGIAKVSDIVSELTASAKEQAQGIGQIGQAVAQMDKVTQGNAASSEESSSAATELASQAQELAAMVGSFRLERSGRAPRSTPPARAAAAAARPARESGVTGPARHRAAQVAPDRIIPLDDDQVFTAF